MDEVRTGNNTLPTLLNPDIRLLNEKDIYSMLTNAVDNGTFSDEGLLRFFIASYKLSKVNELIKDNSDLKERIDKLAQDFKSMSYDGKIINYGPVYTAKIANNPIIDWKNRVAKLFSEFDTLTPTQKSLPEGVEISVVLEISELINGLTDILNEMIAANDSTIDLAASIKQQKFGIKLTNPRKAK